MKLNILVVHEGKRDDYQVARALIESNHAVTLVTSAYSTKTIRRLSQIVKSKSLSKLADRQIQEAPTLQVSSCNRLEMSLRPLVKYLGDTKIQEIIDSSIAKRALDLLKNHRYDIVLCYNYNAFKIFKSAPIDVVKIIFQCHPHPALVRAVMMKSMRQGLVSSKNAEREFAFSDQYLSMLYAEPLLADYYFCASQFTAKSLTACGAKEDRLEVIPYGCADSFRNSSDFNYEVRSGALKLIFVGQFVYRKGLVTLQRVLSRINFPINIIFVGRGLAELDPTEGINNPLISSQVEWNVTTSRLQALYRENDIFFFPSLVEGFAHVILEAMRSGCIPVVSENTCGPDVIRDGIDGYVRPATEVDAYVTVLNRINSQKSLNEMKKSARDRADEFTWSKFRTSVSRAVEGAFNGAMEAGK